jgi:hypothetical protein
VDISRRRAIWGVVFWQLHPFDLEHISYKSVQAAFSTSAYPSFSAAEETSSKIDSIPSGVQELPEACLRTPLALDEELQA